MSTRIEQSPVCALHSRWPRLDATAGDDKDGPRARREAGDMADFALGGRVALVTGASRGLGRHFAGVLAQAGAAVVLAARNQELLAEAVLEIERNGGRAVALPLDVASGKSVRDCWAAAEATLGPIDILVNNAGI